MSTAAPHITDAPDDIAALARGGRTNMLGFALRLLARVPFLFIAGRLYGPDALGRFALAVVVVEFAALLATLGLKRGLAQALSRPDRPQVCVAWDALAVAFFASCVASAILIVHPRFMYPHGDIDLAERLLPLAIFGSALADVSLAALAYRRNVQAAVTARAVVEPWTISAAALGLYFVSRRDGLIVSYVLSEAAAVAAALYPFLRSYGWPRGWSPRVAELWGLAARNAPLAGADAVEWATRNVDRFILGLLFAPGVVGIYYMAQQVASLPQKLKTSFDPILGPVIAASLAAGDRAAIARQVRQVAFWIMAAQLGLALMGAIPGKGVMGTVGPQFVAGTAALAFLLFAEVLATQGAVSESALIYIDRHRNLAISLGMLAFQILLSFGLVALMRWLVWDPVYQAAGPAMAVAASLTITSIIKGKLLSRLLDARVSGWRWTLLWAGLVGTAVGAAFTALPHSLEWLELSAGTPAIALSYLYMIWRFAFGVEDRALFRRRPSVA